MQPQSQFQPQAAYGALPAGYSANPFAKPKPSINWMGVVGSLFVPWLIFIFTFNVQCSSLRYEQESTANLVALVLLGAAVTFGGMAFQAWRNGQDTYWLIFLFVTSAIWWVLGYSAGGSNFFKNFQPVYDISNLNVYPSVDPMKYRGNQLMDAGIIKFTEDSYLRLSLSMSFVNKDTYCAAPIISGPPNGTLPESFDFWAIGKNCCSGHIGDFRCGEYANPGAKSGLRLMSDQDRQYFRLVVKQAEAAFNINAMHPLFLYWMQRPEDEIAAYQDQGMTTTSFAMFGSFAAQLFLTGLATFLYTKR